MSELQPSLQHLLLKKKNKPQPADCLDGTMLVKTFCCYIRFVLVSLNRHHHARVEANRARGVVIIADG